jgi:small subunit ribosomal protein S1
MVTAKVVSVKRGAGFVLENDTGLEFFMPMGLAYLKSEGATGKTITAKVMSIDTKKNSIIISRKAIIEERNIKKKEIIEKISNSDEPIDGTVSKVVRVGLFIDIGGVDGLCYFKEISHKGPVKASDYYKEGDEVRVKVLSYNKEKDQIALSIKQCLPDPWVEVENELEKGDTIAVTVSNFEEYGAFVDLGNDIEGLLHISEISWEKHLVKPQDVLSIGDELEVEVLELDIAKKRLRVSLKSLQPKPFDGFIKKFKEKDMVKGKIVNITNFGLFANIYPGVDGLVHNEDISWENQLAKKENYKKGDEVEVKIQGIDHDKQKVSLSIKATESSPLEEFTKTNKIGSIVTAKIKDFKEFGIFVQLTNKIDGLIRSEDFAPLVIGEVNIGDEIEAVITNIDTMRDKIRLSVKKLEYQRGKELMNQVNDNETTKFGDVLRDKLKK